MKHILFYIQGLTFVILMPFMMIAATTTEILWCMFGVLIFPWTWGHERRIRKNEPQWEAPIDRDDVKFIQPWREEL